MESKEQIKNRLRQKYNIEITPQSDFTIIPDEMLANAHLFDWYDKISIQANTEMTRRLKDATDKAGYQMNCLTKVLVFLAIAQILITFIGYLK